MIEHGISVRLHVADRYGEKRCLIRIVGTMTSPVKARFCLDVWDNGDVLRAVPSHDKFVVFMLDKVMTWLVSDPMWHEGVNATLIDWAMRQPVSIKRERPALS